MKILLSAYACEPNRGTEEGFGWNWAINLAQIGHEVWVLTRPDGQKAIEQLVGVKELEKLHFIYIANQKGAIARILRHAKLNWQYLYVVWQLQALVVAKKLDREIDFDIVHHVSWGSITAGSWLWLLRKPFILGPVGGGQTAPVALKQYFLQRWRDEAIRSLLSRRLAQLNLISRQSVSQADLVLATNYDTYQLAQKLGAKRVELYLDSGLPQDFFQPKLLVRKYTSPLRLLWVGSPVIRKGLRLSLESLAAVDASVPFEFTIVGVSPTDTLLLRSIAEFGLEEKVNCLGRIPWQKVREEYIRNDIFFFTSLRDSFGSQFLEAMACGLPIITLDHQGAKDFIPQNAGIKLPVTDALGTVAALAKAIEYAYYNPQECLQMSQTGYQFARTQTWSNKIYRMTKFYEELLAPVSYNFAVKS